MRHWFDSHDAAGGRYAVFGSARNGTIAASSCLHSSHLRFGVGRHFHLPLPCLQMMIDLCFIVSSFSFFSFLLIFLELLFFCYSFVSDDNAECGRNINLQYAVFSH